MASSSPGRHRGDLGPGVDPPPEPPEQQHQTRAVADQDDEPEHPPHAVHEERHHRRQRREQHRRPPRRPHERGLVRLAGEAGVEVVHQVAGPPVDLRGDGGHERRHQAREDQAEDAGGEVPHHHDRVGQLGIGELRQDHERREPDQHPRPGADHVVEDVEEVGGLGGFPLVGGGREPLDEHPPAVAVPERPPLDEQVAEEGADRQRRVLPCGQEVELVALAAVAQRGGQAGRGRRPRPGHRTSR